MTDLGLTYTAPGTFFHSPRSSSFLGAQISGRDPTQGGDGEGEGHGRLWLCTHPAGAVDRRVTLSWFPTGAIGNRVPQIGQLKATENLFSHSSRASQAVLV